ncbi:MAG: tetratricopeptide repeat protein [Rhodospirillaceae bacterium]|jgi:adenylate cyclase|nr:tetratricopeptide repeat protein [Rhodospirillaceae bacterium]
MSGVQRKLTTILAADVVGFSKMMGNDEDATVDALKSCRAIIDGSITEHNGRIFGGAGDSVIADFSSPVQAVLCAHEFQDFLADRNNQFEENRRMTFRVGINMGDVIIDGDNLFGDGVNVAARLEAMAKPGGVCVSSKVYDEVRRKLDLFFVNGGSQQLKNIEEPIDVYHLGAAEDGADDEAPAQETGQETVAPARSKDGKPRVAVGAIKVVGGDEETAFLAEGLRDVILGGLARQTALTVAASADQGSGEADFVLDGGIRAAGNKLRLTFNLKDTVRDAQVWSERYDRTAEDIFDLEDEISQSIVSELRIRLKALEIEGLENADNESLSLPEMLSKAAGYFVSGYANLAAAAQVLAIAVERNPDNSMAQAMMTVCRYWEREFSPLALAPEAREALLEQARLAVRLDQSSYFAHLVVAIAEQDLLGNFRDAQMHAETALAANPNFTQAQAMAAIAKCHIGDRDEGIAELRRAIAANKEDPHRHRHQRELALALFMDGQHDEAADAVRRLLQQAPELHRNYLAAASIYWLAGAETQARDCMADLLRDHPKLDESNIRATQFADQEAAERFISGLRAAGLPGA